MWHEARKQEKKIRGMLVDYRKRADRRKEFYEKIKSDPNRFLQVHGRKCKIHYEVTDMSDDMHMMAWQGQKDNLIDRFDVRAHLDYIPPPKKEEEQPQEKIAEQERQVNYESFRVLAQNEFLSINESDFLRQVQLEEQFGSAEKSGNVGDEKNKKKNSQANAAIGYTYEDSTATPSHSVPFSQQILSIETSTTSSTRFDEFAKDYSDESDMDMDVSVDVKKIGTQQAHELNNYGKKYGMVSNDLFSFLTRDEDEKMSMKAMKEQEADKILGGGRKSRRERRSQREKRILGKPFTLSPPSYATKQEKTKEDDEEDEESEKSSRDSKSPSVEKITFITSFGGDEEQLQPHPKISIPFKKTMPKSLINLRRNESFADMVKGNSDKLRHLNNTEKRKFDSRDDSRSRSPSRRYGRYRSRSRSRRRFYRSRSRSRSKSRGVRRNYRQSSRSSYSSRERRRSRSNSRRRYSRKRSTSYRRKSYHSRSRSRDRKSYKKSLSRKHSSSRERSRNRRAYSTSSTSSSSSSTSSSSSSRSSPSPEKRVVLKKKSISKEKSKSPVRQVSTAPKARSLSAEKPSLEPPTTTTTTVKRYYGRRKENESSSSLSVDSDDDNDNKKQTGSNESSANDVQKVRSTDIKIGLSKSTVGGPSISNPREKLKKKMQILLNKQYKADKKAETEKIERIMQQQQERDEEMREMAIKLRKRQRELRHKYGGENQDSRSNSESDENGKSPQKSREVKSSSSSSSSEDDNNAERRRKSRSGSLKQRKRFKASISRSPVRYDRSRSKSSGRNYRRRSRSRDFRR